MKNFKVCGSEYEEFLIRMEEFHGYRSPGILLGGLMLDTALEKLAAEILAAAPKIIIHRPVRLARALKDSQPVPTGPCPGCGESYPLKHGPTCPACRGDAYYTYRTPSEDE